MSKLISMIWLLEVAGVATSQEIYHRLLEPPVLTVVIGAKCSDGIVLVADRKISAIYGKELDFSEKIRGDLAHVLIEYAGNVNLFDIFRRYIVGDVVIRQSGEAYTYENVISKLAHLVKRFNKLTGGVYPVFEVIVGMHERGNSKLHYIDFEGNSTVGGYKAIGSGGETANMLCAALQHDKIKMRDFLKDAYLAVMYMNEYCPGLGVGVEQGGIPDIKYLFYNQEWDIEPAKHPSLGQDINDAKNYVDNRLGQIRQPFKDIFLDGE